MKQLRRSSYAVLSMRLGIAFLALLGTVRAAEYPWLARRVWWQPGTWDTEVEFLLHFDEKEAHDGRERKFLDRAPPQEDDFGLPPESDNLLAPLESAPAAGRTPQAANAKPQGAPAPILGDAELVADGRFGGSLHLGGTNGALLLPGLPWRMDCTLEFWLRPESLPGGEPARLYQVHSIDPPGHTPLALELLADGRLRLRWQDEPVADTETALPPGEWTHVALRYAGRWDAWGQKKGRPLQAEILINGAVAATATLPTEIALKKVTHQVGNDTPRKRGFHGQLDELRFSRAMLDYAPPDDAWVDAARPLKDAQAYPFFRDAADLRLHLPFDGNLEPAHSAPGTTAKPTLEMGLFLAESDYLLPAVAGDGLVTGHGGLAPAYPAVGNLDLERGTAAFWMRPVNWDNLTRFSSFDGCNPQFVEIFHVTGDFPAGEAPPRWKGPGPIMRLLFIQHLGQGLSDPPELSPNRWTHVAVTWEREKVRYYLDGELFAHGGDHGPFMALITPDNDYWLAAPKDQHWRSGAQAQAIVFARGGGGLWHPYWHLHAQEPNTVVDDFRVYRRALAPGEIRNLVALYRPAANPKPLPPADMRYTLNALQATLDLEAYPLGEDYGKLAAAQLSLTRRGQEQPAMEATLACSPMGYLTARLESEPLDFGLYDLVAEFRDAAGATLATASHEIVRQQPPWWNNTLGLSTKVMPEFEPMTVNANIVSVIHRDLHLGGSGLPHQIVSAGADLLARPVEVQAEVNGATVAFQDDPAGLEMLEASDVRVDWQGRLTGAGLAVTTRAFMEYDGMMWFEITVGEEVSGVRGQVSGEPLVTRNLKPETRNLKPSPQILDRLTIRIPYRPEDAELMNAPTYFLPENTDTPYEVLRHANRDLGATPTEMGIIYRSNDESLYTDRYNRADLISGAGGEKDLYIDRSMYKLPMERAVLRGSFVPFMHLMGMQRGMFWFAENDRNWTQSTQVPAVVVERTPESVELVLNLISEPVALDAPRTFSFGLIPHPLRKLRPDWRRWPGWGVPFNSGLKGDADQIFSLLPKDGDFSKVPAYWQESTRERTMQEDERRRFREQHGREPTPYERTVPGGFYFTPAIGWVPDHTLEFADRWINDTARPWATIDRYFVDFSAWCHDQWAKTGVLEGYYIDGHCKGWEAVDRGNLAYTLPDGHIQPGYGWRHLRQFFKRMRQTLWDQGIVPHICNHSSGNPPFPGLAFVDVWLESEHFYCTPPSQRDHLDTWSPARMRIAHVGKWGIIPKSLGWIGGQTPYHLAAWIHRQFRAYHANLFLHDIEWPDDLDLKMQQPEIATDPIDFIPYWNDAGLARHEYGEEVLVSAWKEADRFGHGPACTVVVVNRGETRLDPATIRFDTASMGLGDDPTAVKVEDIDPSLLHLMWGQEPRQPIPTEDPTRTEAPAATPPDIAATLAGMQPEDNLAQLDEPASVDLRTAEGRRNHPDAALAWAQGTLTCAIRRHDYRLFRFSRP